jgi:hypothetical protein
LSARATGLVMLAAALCATPALAADPLAPLLACRALGDAEARLACFDRESAALAAAPGERAATQAATPPAAKAPAAVASTPSQAAPPAAAAATATPTAATPGAAAPAAATRAATTPTSSADVTANFGLAPGVITAKEEAAGTRPREPDRIEAHITSIAMTSGRATFSLDNGQLWRELLSEGDLRAKPGDVVTISRGALHSYWLQVKSGGGSKVSRIQ